MDESYVLPTTSSISPVFLCRMGRFRDLCLLLLLLLLPATTQGQELLACSAGTNRLTVASTANAATLASSLECSNGEFEVEWDGDVVVAETIRVYDGTSLTVTGAELSAGAIMDGNSTTQLIYISGGSTLHLTNMTLAHGYSPENGGAIYVGESSRVVLSGNNVFTANVATNWGGAVFVEGLSSILWGGKTTISDNFARDGGGIFIHNKSVGSWTGETTFERNSAELWGGAVFVKEFSNTSWGGTTSISDNFAQDGGGVFFNDGSVGSWTGETTFERNTATWSGGGLCVQASSRASWTGTTTFQYNTAGRAGAMFVYGSSVSWSAGNTTFAHNRAHNDAGALYATLDHRIECSGFTTFRNNTAAAGNGGALGLYGSMSSSSIVDIAGDATFANNTALLNGGGVFSSANPNGQHFENVTFQHNSANVGGAVATFGTGNGDEINPQPAKFLRCRFLSNFATQTGGGLEAAFGHEEIISSYFEDNFAGTCTYISGSNEFRSLKTCHHWLLFLGVHLTVLSLRLVNQGLFHQHAPEHFTSLFFFIPRLSDCCSRCGRSAAAW